MKLKTIIAAGALSGLGILGFLMWRSRSAGSFSSSVSPLSESMKKQMTGISWHTDCPVSLDDLVLVRVSYFTLEGRVETGELIVHKNQSSSVVSIFRNIFNQKFPIENMKRIVLYDGSDPKSMAANNTAAFRCSTRERDRFTSRGTWSEHARGEAVDINPLYNPYVKGSTIQPPGAAEYVDRNQTHPYMVTPGVIDAFEEQGWKWGGDWKSAKDYQHFSKGGR